MNAKEPTSDPDATDAPAQSLDSSRRRSALWRGSAAVVVLAAIAIAILALRTHGENAGKAQAGLGPLDSRSPALNQPAPNFALRDTNGTIMRLSDLRGQVVLVNFWATWCGPCRQEMPAIEQVYRDQQSQGFTALEVDDHELAGPVLEFAHELGETPPLLLDERGSVTAEYALKGLPDSFFVDRQGIVRAVSYGPMTPQSILKNIERARQAAP